MPSSRQLAAIMFTDMVGYTALMQQNESLAVQQRDKAKKILEDALIKNEGKLLQRYGDGTLSVRLVKSISRRFCRNDLVLQYLHPA